MFRNILRSGNRLATAKNTQRLYSTVPPKKPSGGPTLPAMLAVASMGFAAYYTIVKSREGKSNNGLNDKHWQTCNSLLSE
jgi:UMP-CMP kinase